MDWSSDKTPIVVRMFWEKQQYAENHAVKTSLTNMGVQPTQKLEKVLLTSIYTKENCKKRGESTFWLYMKFLWVPWKPATFSEMRNSNMKMFSYKYSCITASCHCLTQHGDLYMHTEEKGKKRNNLSGKLKIKDIECKCHLAKCRRLC